jgi:hypothetical protein
MASPAGRLVRKKVYRVERIEKDFYVVVEGYSHPGGGIYWTEFRAASESPNEFRSELAPTSN